MPAPRVFISYSHDSKAHREWVLSVADQLRARGVDAWLDRYEPVPSEEWYLWMEREFGRADFVLAVCTETYRSRFDHEAPSGTGKGVLYEAHLLRQYLDRHGMANGRVVPILTENQSLDAIPTVLASYSRFRLFSELDGLCEHLLGRSGSPVPPVGETDVCSEGMVQPPAEVLPQPACPDPCPYHPHVPASGSVFVGRDAFMSELWGAIEGGESLSLVGDRRIGKSSVLSQLHERLAQAGYAVCLIDGNAKEGAAPDAFVRGVTGLDASDDLETAADQLLAWGVAERERTKRKPVLLVDEFDGVIHCFPPRFLERCRPMMDEICFVFATRQEIDRIYEEIPVSSPFSNRMAMHRIGLLEDPEAMVGQGGPAFTAADGEDMRRLCGAHPFYLALFGSCLWEAKAHGKSRQGAMDSFLDNAARHLRELWRHLSESERGCVLAAARGHAQARRSLRRRGVLNDQGLPFGEVLTEWLDEEERL